MIRKARLFSRMHFAPGAIYILENNPLSTSLAVRISPKLKCLPGEAINGRLKHTIHATEQKGKNWNEYSLRQTVNSLMHFWHTAR